MQAGFENIAKRNLWIGPLLRAPSVASVFADDLGTPVHVVLRALGTGAGEAVADDEPPPADHTGSIDIVFHDDDFNRARRESMPLRITWRSSSPAEPAERDPSDG